MGDFRLPLRSDYERNPASKWDECCLCGSLRRQALVHFKQGRVVPTEHETVTGATSTDSGTLDKYVLVSGTFAAGTAAGIFILTNPAGYDDANLDIFTKNESLNGSTSGNAMAVAAGTGAVQVTGRMVPDTDLVEYRGKKYCSAHFQFKFRNTWADEAKVDYDENDRGK